MSSILDEPLPLRDFDQSDIDSYILLINESNEHHGERTSLKEKIKGEKMFKANFINDFKFNMDQVDILFIAASVRAEFKKIMYDVHVSIRSNNEVRKHFLNQI